VKSRHIVSLVKDGEQPKGRMGEKALCLTNPKRIVCGLQGNKGSMREANQGGSRGEVVTGQTDKVEGGHSLKGKVGGWEKKTTLLGVSTPVWYKTSNLLWGRKGELEGGGT